jgi:hypothetical protein
MLHQPMLRASQWMFEKPYYVKLKQIDATDLNADPGFRLFFPLLCWAYGFIVQLSDSSTVTLSLACSSAALFSPLSSAGALVSSVRSNN